MKIIGLMAIQNFPLAPEMVTDLCRRCNYISLLFDINTGNRFIWDQVKDTVKTYSMVNPSQLHSYNFIEEVYKWNRWNWRELLIRSIDKVGEVGDVVLFLDNDEKLHESFVFDLNNFIKSEHNMIMFNTEMVTSGWDKDKPVVVYPRARHCKAYKWKRNINYMPYLGYAKPNIKGESIFIPKTPFLHYCFYTRQMAETKQLHK